MTKERAKRFMLTGLAVAGYCLLLPVLRTIKRALAGPELRILTYHSVNDGRSHETNIRPEAFNAQMEILARVSRNVNVEDAINADFPAARNLKPFVAVTFDDGYADNLTVAAPILKRHGLTATCFVSAGYAGTSRLLAHDEGQSPENARLLSWDELRRLKDEGVTIGSHGLSHCRFSELDEKELRRQIEDSKRMLEQQLNAPVRTISFPFGHARDYNGKTIEAVRGAGYEAALTAMYGLNMPGRNLFELRRIGVESSDSVFTLRAKLNGALDLLVFVETGVCRKLVAVLNRILGV